MNGVRNNEPIKMCCLSDSGLSCPSARLSKGYNEQTDFTVADIRFRNGILRGDASLYVSRP